MESKVYPSAVNIEQIQSQSQFQAIDEDKLQEYAFFARRCLQKQMCLNKHQSMSEPKTKKKDERTKTAVVRNEKAETTKTDVTKAVKTAEEIKCNQSQEKSKTTLHKRKVQVVVSEADLRRHLRELDHLRNNVETTLKWIDTALSNGIPVKQGKSLKKADKSIFADEDIERDRAQRLAAQTANRFSQMMYPLELSVRDLATLTASNYCDCDTAEQKVMLNKLLRCYRSATNLLHLYQRCMYDKVKHEAVKPHFPQLIQHVTSIRSHTRALNIFSQDIRHLPQQNVTDRPRAENGGVGGAIIREVLHGGAGDMSDTDIQRIAAALVHKRQQQQQQQQHSSDPLIPVLDTLLYSYTNTTTTTKTGKLPHHGPFGKVVRFSNKPSVVTARAGSRGKKGKLRVVYSYTGRFNKSKSIASNGVPHATKRNNNKAVLKRGSKEDGRHEKDKNREIVESVGAKSHDNNDAFTQMGRLYTSSEADGKQQAADVMRRGSRGSAHDMSELHRMLERLNEMEQFTVEIQQRLATSYSTGGTPMAEASNSCCEPVAPVAPVATEELVKDDGKAEAYVEEVISLARQQEVVEGKSDGGGDVRMAQPSVSGYVSGDVAGPGGGTHVATLSSRLSLLTAARRQYRLHSADGRVPSLPTRTAHVPPEMAQRVAADAWALERRHGDMKGPHKIHSSMLMDEIIEDVIRRAIDDVSAELEAFTVDCVDTLYEQEFTPLPTS